MTREEEIIKMSNIYSEYEYNQTDYGNGFINGAKWADRHPKSPWISVDEDLPCNHEELLSSNPVGYSQETTFVLVIDITGSIVISMMVNDSGKWEWVRWPALYWMPIPELPKE